MQPIPDNLLAALATDNLAQDVFVCYHNSYLHSICMYTVDMK